MADAEHSLFNCTTLTGSRFELELSLGRLIDEDSLVNIMLKGKREWKLVHDFVKHIMSLKRKVEQRDERQRRTSEKM